MLRRPSTCYIYFLESRGFKYNTYDTLSSQVANFVGQPDEAKECLNLVDQILELAFSLGQTQDLEQMNSQNKLSRYDRLNIWNT